MSTVSAIAEANSENYDRLQENKKQIEELSKTIVTIKSEAQADRDKSIQKINALINRVDKTTHDSQINHQQILGSYSELKKIQKKTFVFKTISWYFPLFALFITGGAGVLAGGWLATLKYNTFEENYGRNLFNWNRDRLTKCENDDNPKCTFWIVSPDSSKRQEAK